MQTLTNVHGKEFPHHIPGKLNSANCFDKFNIIPKTEIEYENELQRVPFDLVPFLEAIMPNIRI